MLQAQIFIDRDELHGSTPVYEFIMRFLLIHQIDGATAFKGVMGFGKNHKMNRPNELFSIDDLPMMIVFVDTKEKTMAVLQDLRQEYKGGFIITHSVDAF